MPPPSIELANGPLDFPTKLPFTALFVPFVLGAFVVYGIGFVIYRAYLDPLSKVPGPKLLAVTRLPYLYQEHIQGSWVRHVAKLHQQYGPVVRIGPGSVSIDGAIAYPQVWAHQKGKPECEKAREFWRPGDEHSIIASPIVVHRRQRRTLAHAFSDSSMYEQEPVISQYVSLLMQHLTDAAHKGEPIDIVKFLNFTTFDIIGDLAFNESFQCLESNDYHPWVMNIFKGIRGGAVRRFLVALPWLKPFVQLNKGAAAAGLKVEMQQQTMAEEKAMKRIAQGEAPSGRKDFMTYMMRKNRDGEHGMLEHEMIANSPLLVLAGSETTATALSGFFFYLVRNPEVYRTLVDEIRGAFQSEEDISMRTCTPLEYLGATLEETLRMYPPAALTPPRVSNGDKIGGYYLPKDTVINTYQWATFRNPANFADPDSFCPERFLPASHPRHQKQFENDNRACFKPFSTGPRDCIGKNLAYAEMRVIVSRILYRFDYTHQGNVDDWHETQNIFIIWEKTPLMLKLTPRKM